MYKILGLLTIFALASVAAAQDSSRISNLERQASSLETRVSANESRATRTTEISACAVIFGAFCALWAQNTGRNAWLWFFLGLFFSVITVLVVLYKNSNGPKNGPGIGRKPFDLQHFRQQ